MVRELLFAVPVRLVRAKPALRVAGAVDAVRAGRKEELVIRIRAGGIEGLEDGIGVVVYPVSRGAEIFDVDHPLPLFLGDQTISGPKGRGGKRKMREATEIMEQGEPPSGCAGDSRRRVHSSHGVMDVVSKGKYTTSTCPQAGQRIS